MFERLGVLGLGLASVVALLGMACLEPPPFVRSDVGSVDGRATSLSITSVVVRALDGSEWPAGAMPRRPQIEITFSAQLDPEEAPIFLLTGTPDEALTRDLAGSPLRAENLARAIPCDVHRELQRIELVPRAPLPSGMSFTLAIGSWARSGRLTLGAPSSSPLTVSSAVDAGAEATSSWPPDGASDVGTNLSEVLIQFDGPLQRIADAAVLEGPEGAVAVRIESRTCERRGLTGECIGLVLLESLAPLSSYSVRVTDARDATGAPLLPWMASFRTGSGPDETPPSLAALPCGIDEQAISEGCLLVTDERIALRARTSEPVLAEFRVGDASVRVLGPRGALDLSITSLSADGSYAVSLDLVDLAGLREHHAITVHTLLPLPRVTISEVRADPLGREPTQEYVELLSLDDAPIELGGFTLADALDRPGDVLPEATLSPGSRILLVADGFNPDDGSEDAPIPLGASLLRMGTSLGDAGLSNSGEPLVLRDASGARLSFVPAMAPPEAGACLVRRGDDPRSERASDFEYARSACSPGR